MDPTANLTEQLELARVILSDGDGPPEAERLAELVAALHAWLVAGGFLPSQWQGGRR